ncbi:hypothetical protein N9971_00160 [bacterium]|nr:hypothetical protein [bacterium]
MSFVTNRSRRQTFLLSLTEVTLLLVFLLLALSSTYRAPISTPEEYESLQERLLEYEKNEDLYRSFGLSSVSVQRLWSRLISADLVERNKATLVQAIEALLEERERLLRDERRMEVELASIRNETGHLTSQLEQCEADRSEGGKGSEPGSCWEDSAGRIEYLLEVVIRDSSLLVTPAWPSRRADQLADFGLNGGLEPQQELSANGFAQLGKPVFDRVIQRDCRLFVLLLDETTGKDSYKRQKALVERYFFIREHDAS